MPITAKYGKLYMKDASGNLVQIVPRTSADVPDYQGATSSSAGIAGLVPAAQASQKDYYLKGDGTWAELLRDFPVQALKGANLSLRSAAGLALQDASASLNALIDDSENLLKTYEQTNPTTVALSTASAEDLVNNDADYICSNDTLTSITKTIQGKTVDLNNVQLNSAWITVIANDAVNIDNLQFSGRTDKTVTHSNHTMQLNSNGYIKLINSSLVQTTGNGYDSISIGLYGTMAPKGVLIDNCAFGNLTNNGIEIFKVADNGIITISNCTFNNMSNPIRISNPTNVKMTLNLINCTFDNIEHGPNNDYAGIIICQDYTSNSVDAVAANNLFAPNKITINVSNCYGYNGVKIVRPASMSEILGSGSCDNPLLYIYADRGGIVSYNATKYPSVNIYDESPIDLYNEDVVALSGSAIDLSLGRTFTKTISANTTFTITNAPAGKMTVFTLGLTNGGAYTVTWPNSVSWNGGDEPELAEEGVNILTFTTLDGGTHWYAGMTFSS